MKKIKWVNIALTYLVIIALIGTYMRLKFVFPISLFQYDFILHSHSHVAILGWVYSALYIALLHCYLGEDSFNNKRYTVTFWLTQFSIVGMLVTFAIQGYAAFSIAFSTLHILLSYRFILLFVKDSLKIKDNKIIHSSSILFIYTALIFLFLSSFGPWGLAVLASKKMLGTDLYKDAIYFYLHFQYNGWFTFAILGLFLYLLEKSGIPFNKKLTKIAFWILFCSTIPAYLLSISFEELTSYIIYIAFISGCLQLIGIIIYILIIVRFTKLLTQNLPGIIRFLFLLSLLSVELKFILQFISGFPEINQMVFINRDIVIGFIHLVMLGFVTSGMIFWFSNQRIINSTSKSVKFGLILFAMGFITTELFLFTQVFNDIPSLSGIMEVIRTQYHIRLLIFTFLILIGIIIFWLPQIYNKDFKET